MSWPAARRLLWPSLLVLCLSLASVACDKTGKELMREASASIAREDAQAAERSLQEAVKKDPSLKPESDRLMARVHMMRKEYDKAEQALLDLWSEQGLGAEGLDTRQKQQKQLIQELLTELYRVWADSIDGKQSPTKYEEILRKGLERDPKDVRLNTMLVDFYLKHAESLIQEGQKAQAADVFDKIYTLRTSPQRRSESQSRAASLRVEVYEETVLKRFEAELKPKLLEAQRFDEAKGQVRFIIELEVDKRLRPGKEEDEQLALKEASQRLEPALKDFVRQLHAFAPDMALAGRPEGVEVLDKKLEKGKYTLTAAAPLKELVLYGRLLHERAQRTADPKKDAPASPQDPAQAPAQDPSSTAPDQGRAD